MTDDDFDRRAAAYRKEFAPKPVVADANRGLNGLLAVTCIAVIAGVALFAFNSYQAAHEKDCRAQLREGYVASEKGCDDVISSRENSERLYQDIDALVPGWR